MDDSEPIYDVFEALDLAEPETLVAISNLASRIIKTIASRDLSDVEAAELAGCSLSRIDRIHRADLDGFTIDELCRYLVALGQDVRIAVETADTDEAHLRVLG